MCAAVLLAAAAQCAVFLDLKERNKNRKEEKKVVSNQLPATTLKFTAAAAIFTYQNVHHINSIFAL